MSRVTKGFGVVAAVCLAVVIATTAGAGDWSAEQKDVWGNVTAYWAAYAAGDVDGFMSYVHEDYSGWGYEQPLPAGKESSRKWMSYSMTLQKVRVYEVTPVGIMIHGDVAVVHYYYAYAYEDAEGEQHNEQGRWTDILVKQGSKWVLFADHGGSIEGDD